MIDDSVLAVNLLSFRLKSFAYERSAEVDGTSYALFHRTETESESKLRPRILQLWVAVPRPWLVYDEPSDALLIAEDGEHPGPQPTGTALEAAADRGRFSEQGVEWVRDALDPTAYLYAPARAAELLGRPGARAALGLAPPS